MLSKNQNNLMAICAQALFGEKAQLNNPNYADIVNEAISQAVLPLIESVIYEQYDSAHKKAMFVVSKNVNSECIHYEIHDLLTKNGISYLIFKGVSSASYYREPILRTMGDIDLLVKVSDLEKADKLLRLAKYIPKTDFNINNNHNTYLKKTGKHPVLCEMHRTINGIPNNEKENVIRKYLENIFENANEYQTENGSYVVPNKFHHGLVLLLHTAAHLTSEGIGLRHLCDWAVFANSISNDEFIEMFEKPLKEAGLWRFAQLLTLCSVRYLGCKHKNWAGVADDKLLEDIVADIFDGGNFGNKDEERTRQIKYIKNTKNKTVDKNSPALQAFYNIDLKAKSEFKFVDKHKFLLPIGWMLVVFEYVGLVVGGKRKLDGLSTVSKANARKELYSNFRLFQTDDK